MDPRLVAGGFVAVLALGGLVLWITGPEAPEAATPAAIDTGPRVIAAPDAAAPAAAVAPSNVFEGKLQRNQTLTAALQVHGVSVQQVHAIVSALSDVYDFRRARPGAAWRLELDPKQRTVASFRFVHGTLDVFEAVRGPGGTLTGRRVDVPVRILDEEVGAEIQTSLYRAMQRTGESAALVALVVDVFAWDIDFFKDTRPGDRFRVVVERIYKDEEFVRYGRILAAEYAGQKATFRVIWFDPDGDGEVTGDYYLDDGRSARKTFLATPLKFGRISSGYNRKRKHPILGYTRAHLAIDYAAPRGTPVWAMAPGKVVFAGRKGPNGNLVVIDHGRRMRSYYAHLHRIRRGIKRGVRVEQKQVIGTVGSTGRATGPHLHFVIKRNGKAVNPLKMKMKRGDPVAKASRAAFDALVTQRRARLDKIELTPAGAQ